MKVVATVSDSVALDLYFQNLCLSQPLSDHNLLTF